LLLCCSLPVLAFVACAASCHRPEESPTMKPAATSPATRARMLAKPTTLPGVDNFAQVSPSLYRGEQPTAEGFAQLKQRGIKTVVNLRAFHDDRDLLKGSGLRYVHIPEKAWHPEDEDIAKFLKVMQGPANQPVFVHCQQGSDRTGCTVAVYRMVVEGWSVEDAMAEMQNFHFHAVWTEIGEYLGHFDVEAMRKQVEKTEAPKVEVID
jgi:tyrosine-protein phosphatase SIW14